MLIVRIYLYYEQWYIGIYHGGEKHPSIAHTAAVVFLRSHCFALSPLRLHLAKRLVKLPDMKQLKPQQRLS